MAKRFKVEVKLRNGKGWRMVKPGWASKVKGKLSYRRAGGLRDALRRRGRKARRRAVEGPTSYPWGKNKDCMQRRMVFELAQSFHVAHTGGDRTPTRNNQVGGVADSRHLTTRKDVWADDYAPSQKFVQALRDRRAGEVKVIDVPHGTGPHVHVSGVKQ